MTYRGEAGALDREILGIIEAWHQHGTPLDDEAFNDLALRLFEHQLRYNTPYARYCAGLGVTQPKSWDAVPPVPSPAFKDAAITTFDPSSAALVFETSGTTVGAPGRHYMETPALYDAALIAGFDRFILPDGARLRYFNLVPNPAARPTSSLGYMMARVAQLRGEGRTGWYLEGNALSFDRLQRDLREAIAQDRPVCIAATAFALVHLVDAMRRENVVLRLPNGSRIMETGGFKGRARTVHRDELHAAVADRLELQPENIIEEYGMTELTSQYYGDPATARKIGPPWLRARVVGPDRKALPAGEIGSLLHVDLANRSSCIAVQTEDIGVQFEDGFVLLGRAAEAAPRGCSLGAEDLRSIMAGAR